MNADNPRPEAATAAAPPTALIHGKRLAQWPPNLYIPPQALEVFLETFQGPLDLLLYLIRKQNLDILDIPVARITAQYMEYVELMRRLQLDLAAEYLVMAAVLVEIKSRMLLPRPPAAEDEEEEDPRAALVRQLQEYERFRRAARDLDARPRLERDLYLAAAAFDPPAAAAVLPVASLNDLVVAYQAVAARAAQYKNWEIGQDTLTVRDKITQIMDKIKRHRFIRFEDLIDCAEGRRGLVVSFMAVLELARGRMLAVVQNEPFAPIHIKGVAADVR